MYFVADQLSEKGFTLLSLYDLSLTMKIEQDLSRNFITLRIEVYFTLQTTEMDMAKSNIFVPQLPVAPLMVLWV